MGETAPERGINELKKREEMTTLRELGRHHVLVSPSSLRVRDRGSGLWDAEGVCPLVIGAGRSANPSSANGKHLANEGRRQRRGLKGGGTEA